MTYIIQTVNFGKFILIRDDGYQRLYRAFAEIEKYFKNWNEFISEEMALQNNNLTLKSLEQSSRLFLSLLGYTIIVRIFFEFGQIGAKKYLQKFGWDL